MPEVLREQRPGGLLSAACRAGLAKWRATRTKMTPEQRRLRLNELQRKYARARRARRGSQAVQHGDDDDLSLILTVTLSPQDLHRLHSLCERLKTGRAHFIRRAIRHYRDPWDTRAPWRPSFRTFRTDRTQPFALNVNVDPETLAFIDQRAHPQGCPDRNCQHRGSVARSILRRFMTHMESV